MRASRRDPWLRRAPTSVSASLTAACAAVLVIAAGVARSQTAPAAPSPAPAAAPAPMPVLPDGFLARFIKWNQIEWGQPGPPSDPSAPASRRPAPWPAQPETTPPMPFTEWPYGGATDIGTNRAASVDSPLMVALAPTALGKAMAATNIQFYGWVDVGGNISSMNVKGGNAPAAYDYNPNTIQLDQAVVYLERTPDTVQDDHVDWGHLWRELSLYDVLWTGQLPTAQAQRQLRL